MCDLQPRKQNEYGLTLSFIKPLAIEFKRLGIHQRKNLAWNLTLLQCFVYILCATKVMQIVLCEP